MDYQKNVDVAFKKVRYGEDVPKTLQAMAASGYKLQTAYHVGGDGHYLYFCKPETPWFKTSDSEKRLTGQVGSIPDIPRDPARQSH